MMQFCVALHICWGHKEKDQCGIALVFFVFSILAIGSFLCVLAKELCDYLVYDPHKANDGKAQICEEEVTNELVTKT